uniref:Uncharacterized protein n=1 Tax=Romanomermis culicivorax TaxID=13658 RepID=A0A915JY40_ROMCU
DVLKPRNIASLCSDGVRIADRYPRLIAYYTTVVVFFPRICIFGIFFEIFGSETLTIAVGENVFVSQKVERQDQAHIDLRV